MTDCEMCGKNLQTPLKAKVEGTIMNVCPNCARFGETIVKPRMVPSRQNFSRSGFTKRTDPDMNKIVVSNYGPLVKSAREKKGLKQEELAKQLSEKESIIHKIESNNFRPSFLLARKLERFFNIRLIEEMNVQKKEETNNKPQGPEQELTMEDLLKKAMAKKK